METEAVEEKGLLDVVENLEVFPCHSLRHRSISVPARSHQKLSEQIWQDSRSSPPNSYCVKFQSFAIIKKLVNYNDDKYESRLSPSVDILGGNVCLALTSSFINPFKIWKLPDPIFDWRLAQFSTRDRDSYTCDSFSSGGRNWVLKVYPNGVGPAQDNSLSLYLLGASNENGYVKAKLRVLNQIQSTHVEKQVEGWPSTAENGWGFDKFIPLADLKDASNGFLVNDTLKIEVEILSFSKVDSL